MKPGDKVTFQPLRKTEYGIIKSMSGDNHAFVVYHCAGEWERYYDYTAERTRLVDLVPGWINERSE